MLKSVKNLLYGKNEFYLIIHFLRVSDDEWYVDYRIDKNRIDQTIPDLQDALVSIKSKTYYQ